MISNSVPILAAWEPHDHLPPQRFNYTYNEIPASFLTKGEDLFNACNPVAQDASVDRKVITVILSPSDVYNANVRLRMAESHRGLVESYMSAFVHQFLNAEGLLRPANDILEYFGTFGDLSMIETESNYSPAYTPEYTDKGFIASICSQHLPAAYPVTVQTFDPKRAIVWLCKAGVDVDVTPEFLCVGGWTRWCALAKAMSCKDVSVKMKDAEGSAQLDYAVPVYILDGSKLSELETHCLASWLNLHDRTTAVASTAADAESNSQSVQGGISSLSDINSRPYGIGDWLTVFDIVVKSVLEAGAEDEMAWTQALASYISSNVELDFLRHWMLTSPGGTNETDPVELVSMFRSPNNRRHSAFESLCDFMASFTYPYDYRRSVITVGMMRESGVQRTFFWERVLCRLIPYQALCTTALSDICSIVRSIEPFMMVRAKDIMAYCGEWDQANRNESFVYHFITQNESVNRFVRRLCSSEKICDMKTKSVLWPYDSLASCTCFYNYHYLIELDSRVGVSDEIPDTLERIKFNTGTERALLMSRAILLYSALTYQNPLYHLQLARKDHSRAPLERITRPKLFESANCERGADGSLRMICRLDDGVAEQCFESLLGVIGELVFRCACSGTGRRTLYEEDKTVTEWRNYGRSETHDELEAERLHTDMGYLRGMLHGGALSVQYLITVTYGIPIQQMQLESPNQLPVDAILPLVVTTPPQSERSSSYHCFQVSSINSCRRRIYENCLALTATGFDPGNFSHLHVLFNVLMLFHERGYEESTETASELLTSERVSIPMPEQTSSQVGGLVDNNILTKAVSQIHDSWSTQRAATASPRMSTHNPEARTRIIRWFEQTKGQARELMAELYESFKTSGDSVVLACDFRHKSPEEAKAMAGVLSELASESTNLSSSLQDVPYQFEVRDCSKFKFSRMALDTIMAELMPVMRTNLEEGLNTYLNVQDASDVVVVSARAGVICALWQALAHLSPFFDLLHPLACQWLAFRAMFTSWLWGCIRERMHELWKALCHDKLGDANVPALRFTLIRLPAKFDKSYLNSIHDLTSERLTMLFRGSGPLDKIGAAFYRFQCSSMADARSVLGTGANGGIPLVKDLDNLLQSHEPCMKMLFEKIWTTVDPDLPAEEVLNNSQFAAAGFLKKYAKYVLSGLENQDKAFDALGGRIDAAAGGLSECNGGGTEISGRTRKRKIKEEEMLASSAVVRTSGSKKVEDLPKSILAGYNTIHELKRDLKLLCRVGAEPSRPEVPRTEWLTRLPSTLRSRLAEQPLPKQPLINEILSRCLQQLRALRSKQLHSHRSGDNGPKRRRVGLKQADETMANEDDEQAPTEQQPMSSVFFSLPGWLKDNPLWSLWGSALKRDQTWYTVPSTLDFREEPVVDQSGMRMSSQEWEVISAVLEYLSDRGVTAMYCSRTHEVIPITPRGCFANLSYSEAVCNSEVTMQPPPRGDFPRRNAMYRFRSVLEGDLLGYSRRANSLVGEKDTLTSCLL